METSEIQELLEKMNVLKKQEQSLSINPQALMVDPIVSNKLAVELLQKVDREAKPEIVLSLSGVDSYFAYNIALSAWMKFGVCDFESEEIASSTNFFDSMIKEFSLSLNFLLFSFDIYLYF